MIKRNIRLLELQEVGQSGLFFLPIMVLYFRDEIGLTYQDFLLTEAIFAATIILMEVPSGWLADIWQRRHSLLVASLFWVFGLYLLLIADGFLLCFRKNFSYLMSSDCGIQFCPELDLKQLTCS